MTLILLLNVRFGARGNDWLIANIFVVADLRDKFKDISRKHWSESRPTYLFPTSVIVSSPSFPVGSYRFCVVPRTLKLRQILLKLVCPSFESSHRLRLISPRQSETVFFANTSRTQILYDLHFQFSCLDADYYYYGAPTSSYHIRVWHPCDEKSINN